jgi:hypothetical protein
VFTPIKIVRFWLPGLIFVVGAAMLVISPDIIGLEGAALMLGGGLGVVVSNRIHQMGIRGEKDRDDEMGARQFMERYGVWPDEASEQILDRAERAGDIEPRTPVEDPTPARVDPHSRPASRTAAPKKTGAHPHSGVRRGPARTSRRPPRR